MKIAVHTLVKNEERFVWYSVMSVIEHVDKIYLWDTGSTDNTFAVLQEIAEKYPQKVNLRRVGSITPDEFPRVRQEMLDATTEDWFLMVDGDEIWWNDSIKKVVKVIKDSKDGKLESIVVPVINLVGDMYHFQESMAGNYQLVGKKGHYALRAIKRSIPGLTSLNPHGTWGWVDKDGKMIQDRNAKKIKFVDAPYLHATHLQRAGGVSKEKDVPKRKQKLKKEIGKMFPFDFYYPEAFFYQKPKIVPDIWKPMSTSFKIIAYLQTPLRKIKRRLTRPRVGY